MTVRPPLRCAIYTRVSTDHGLEQEFNSLDAQREASEAYVKSQAHEGWVQLPDHYDDGGYSGGSLQRPALQNLLAAVRERRIDIIVVYKVDRLTRSLADFARLVELFDGHGVSFVSVTQSFNTTSSMGRLTLNVLLSFAQFEREVTGERIRDKIAASKRKGLWMGGQVPLGYRAQDRSLAVVDEHAAVIRSPKPKSDILFSERDDDITIRPMRVEAHGRLVQALGKAHHWLDELQKGRVADTQTLAEREGCSERSIRLTLSLAFVAPDIIQAALDRKLPRGFGLSRLTSLPMDWAEQRRALGLAEATAN